MLCLQMKCGMSVGVLSDLSPPRSTEEYTKNLTSFDSEASMSALPCFSSVVAFWPPPMLAWESWLDDESCTAGEGIIPGC